MGTLLGHLSQFGSFSTQGEVLCTQGLAHLLREHPDARSAFAAEIASVTGVRIGNDLTWRAEAHQDLDRGRPDLEARTVSGVPTVKIEAKLGATLSPGQCRSYVSDLHGRSPESALLVLVPRPRTEEATDAVAEAFGLSGPSPWRPTEYPDVAIAVISWDDVLAALGRGGSERLRSEREQFEAMYRVLSGDYIPPLAGPEELAEWRKRETDFVNLVDQLTRRLTTHHRVYPMSMEPLEQVPEGLEPKGYTRRYVCRLLGETESCFSIGVRDSFAGIVSPIWLRFNKTTGHFREIRARLDTSDLRPRLVPSGGHIWIPLDVPLGVAGRQVVDALVAQAEEVVRVAYQPTP
jgi:hypothetical protein